MMVLVSVFEWHFERFLLPGVLAGLAVMILGFVLTMASSAINRLINRKKEGNYTLLIKIIGLVIGIAGLAAILATAV